MFNIYAPFYHRSHEIYPARHKKKLVKDIFELFGKNISARNLEHFVGACVTLLNVDESRFKNIHGFPNPSLLIDTSGIKNWMLGKDSKDMAVSRPTYFSAEIALLHDLGVIDSFNISEILKSTNEEAKELIYQSYERIIENAKKQIGKRINKELNHGDLSQIINSQHFKTIGLRQPDARILTKNKKTEFIPQKIIEQLIIESERSLRNFSDDQAAIESSVQDFYYNISFLQWSIFRADSKSFIVVRDYPFLRRIIGGGDDWLYEIALRGELYNSVLKERHRIKGQTVKDPRFRIQRLQNYLSYLESYVIGHWSMGLDVDYCGSHRLNSSSPASWRHGVSR